MHRPSSRDRDRRHLDDRRRHLDAEQSRHRHLERRLDVRHRQRRHPGDRPDDQHLLGGRLEARGADPDAEPPGGGRLGSAGEDRLRHLDGGRHRLRHQGACPGSRRTGCCLDANGPCPGWTRTGCSLDAGLDGVHEDAGWLGLRHHQSARALRRREQRDAACSASARRRPLRVQQERRARESRSEPQQPEPAQACAWVQGSEPMDLRPQPSVPEQRAPLVPTGPASCLDGRSRALRRLDAGRPASTPMERRPEDARYRRRWFSAPRGGDGPRGARRSTMRS